MTETCGNTRWNVHLFPAILFTLVCSIVVPVLIYNLFRLSTSLPSPTEMPEGAPKYERAFDVQLRLRFQKKGVTLTQMTTTRRSCTSVLILPFTWRATSGICVGRNCLEFKLPLRRPSHTSELELLRASPVGDGKEVESLGPWPPWRHLRIYL